MLFIMSAALGFCLFGDDALLQLCFKKITIHWPNNVDEYKYGPDVYEPDSFEHVIDAADEYKHDPDVYIEGDLRDDIIVLHDESIRTIKEGMLQIATGKFETRLVHRECKRLRIGVPPGLSNVPMIWLANIAYDNGSTEINSYDIVFAESWIRKQKQCNIGSFCIRKHY